MGFDRDSQLAPGRCDDRVELARRAAAQARAEGDEEDAAWLEAKAEEWMLEAAGRRASKEQLRARLGW